MKKLSDRQQQILKFIHETIRATGFSPSIAEISAAIGGDLNPGTISGHLVRLEKKGLIRRSADKRRSIEIINRNADDMAVPVPIVGQVTAGQPILAQENIEEYFAVPTDVVKNEQVYMLKVKGDSMKDAGIFDGDLILVRKQNTAEDGEIVVAMTEDNEATVKRFYREGDHFRLQPENDAYEPIVVSQVTILGKVIGVYRVFSETIH